MRGYDLFLSTFTSPEMMKHIISFSRGNIYTRKYYFGIYILKFPQLDPYTPKPIIKIEIITMAIHEYNFQLISQILRYVYVFIEMVKNVILVSYMMSSYVSICGRNLTHKYLILKKYGYTHTHSLESCICMHIRKGCRKMDV